MFFAALSIVLSGLSSTLPVTSLATARAVAVCFSPEEDCTAFAVDAIDRPIVEWGMPMGPLTLIDQIGFDVIVGIFRAMQSHLGDRVLLPRASDQRPTGNARACLTALR